MADDKDKDKKPDDKDHDSIFDANDMTGGEDDSSADSSADSSDDSSSDDSSSDDSSSEDSEIPEDPKQAIDEAASVLAEHGLVVGATSDPLQFIRHICTAAKSAKATKEMVAAENKPTTGVGADAGAGGTPTEEQRPYLMSTMVRQSMKSAGIELSTALLIDPKTEANPEKKALLLSLHAGIAHDQKRARETKDKQIKRLEKAGAPKHLIDQWKERAGGYHLSLADTGEYVPQKLDIELKAWAAAAKHFKGGAQLSTLTTGELPGGVTQQERPGQDPAKVKQQEKEDQEYMIRQAGLPVPAAAK